MCLRPTARIGRQNWILGMLFNSGWMAACTIGPDRSRLIAAFAYSAPAATAQLEPESGTGDRGHLCRDYAA